MLHGFSGCSTDWSLFVPFFSQFFHVITIDLIGHGETDAPTDSMRYALKHIRRDLTTIIEDLTDQPAHLLGYSMGGRLALYLALSQQSMFRSLILESTSPGIEDEEDRVVRKESDEDLADRIEQLGIEAFVEEWESMPMWESQSILPTETLQRQRETRLASNPIGLANSLRGYGTGVQPSLWDKLYTLNMPTLLLAGEKDPKYVAVAKGMEAQIPYSRLEVLPRTGHNTHLENPRAFASQVLEFLRGFGAN